MNTKNILFKAGIGLAGAALFASAALYGIGASAQIATISNQLDLGAKGQDVITLQTFLAKYPSYYPSGLVTGYYGSLTAAAVTRFQAAYGLAQVGRVGPMTLAEINSLIDGGAVTSGPDIWAPTMSTVQIIPTSNSASFSWNTGENARIKIFYATTPLATAEATSDFTEPYTSGSVVQDSGFSTGHSLSITGLSPNTTYYYMTESIDAAGNVTVWPFPAGVFTTTS